MKSIWLLVILLSMSQYSLCIVPPTQGEQLFQHVNLNFTPTAHAMVNNLKDRYGDGVLTDVQGRPIVISQQPLPSGSYFYFRAGGLAPPMVPLPFPFYLDNLAWVQTFLRETQSEIQRLPGPLHEILRKLQEKDTSFSNTRWPLAHDMLVLLGLGFGSGHQVKPLTGLPTTTPSGQSNFDKFPYQMFKKEDDGALQFTLYVKEKLESYGMIGPGLFEVLTTAMQRFVFDIKIGAHRFGGGIDHVVVAHNVLSAVVGSHMAIGIEAKQKPADRQVANADPEQQDAPEASAPPRRWKLTDARGQVVMEQLSAIAWNVDRWVADVYLTEGENWILYRYDGDTLLEYENLTTLTAIYTMQLRLKERVALKQLCQDPQHPYHGPALREKEQRNRAWYTIRNRLRELRSQAGYAPEA